MRILFSAAMLMTTLLLSGVPFTPRDSNRIAKAEKLQSEEDYYKALRILKRLYKKYPDSPDAALLLSKGHCLIPDREPAFQILRSILEHDSLFRNRSDIVDFYIRELLLDGRFEIAKSIFERRARLLGLVNSPMSKPEQFFKDTSFVDVAPIPSNSAFSDFSPILYKNGLLFYSNRKKPADNTDVISESKADLFYLEKTQSPNIKLFNQLFGYGQYEGSFVFYRRFEQLFLTKYMVPENQSYRMDNKLTGLKLFQSTVDTSRNIITTLNALPINLHGFSMAHPSTNEQGDILYFVSNIPGGQGGADIYRIKWDGTEWSLPENMGPEINSPADEFFPFLFEDSILFFSSNREGGHGAFDIYQARLDRTRSKVTNMGIPINSAANDLSFVANTDGLSGFFVSNRTEGYGQEDIYTFKITKIRFPIMLNDIDLNDLNEDSKILITNLQGEVISSAFLTDREIDLPVTNAGHLRATIVSGEFSAQIELPVHHFSLAHPEWNIAIPRHVIDQLKSKPLTAKYRVQIAATQKESTTSALRKIYAGPMSIKSYREGGWVKYYIAEFDNYYQANLVKQNCGVSDAFVAAYRDTNRISVMDAIAGQYQELSTRSFGTKVSTEKVYFDYNSAIPKKSWEQSLNRVANIVINNDSLNIAIYAFTDSVGSYTYNKGLAAERARTIRDLLLRKGVQSNHIHIIGGPPTFLAGSNDAYTVGKSDETNVPGAEIYIIVP